MNYIERKKHNFPRAEARGFGKAVEERRNHTIGISIAESVKIWRNPLSDNKSYLQMSLKKRVKTVKMILHVNEMKNMSWRLT